jgi:hypothetical protein
VTDTASAAARDCKNCGAPLPPEARFCSACGQRAEVARLTLPHLLHEVPHAIFHVDRGFVPTLRGLFRAPGVTINGYLDGRRIHVFNPLTLLVLLAGLSAVLYSAYPFQLAYRAEGMSEAVAAHYTQFVALQFKFYSMTLLVYVPALALITWLSFWRNGRRFGEYVVVNAFVMAGASAIMLAMFPFMVLADRSGQLAAMMNVYVILAGTFQVVAWQRVFVLPDRGLSTAFRAAMAMVLYLAIVSVLPVLVFQFWYLPLVV